MLTTLLALPVIATQIVVGYLAYQLKVEWPMLEPIGRRAALVLLAVTEYTTIAGFIAVF